MPSDEEARLRRALKQVAEEIEEVVYHLPPSKARSKLEAIARAVRAVLAEPASDPRGG